MEKKSNFCLFMPLFDLLGGTLDDKSWELQKEISSGKNEQVPDFVFLAHVVDVMSSMHVSFVFRSFSALPFCTKPQMLLMWPAMGGSKMGIPCEASLNVVYSHLDLNRVCVCSLQYFLPFATDGINDQIEQAILRADRLGVKVLSLAALNKVDFLFFPL
ncbi:hypothetical protein BHM03_00003875 [Ensete ventricosum]|uniref:Uncharacterized protein n=1 Tax=Ensete ventricosum TaxID=4639 RepID=A0A445MA69_ENSVE|nr:hypothetical protein BHM03_00003875 [Ensete ventricosum]